MRYPFDGSYVVTSPWGWRPGGIHRGVDFGLPNGTPVISVGDGVVSLAAYESDAGNHLVIRLDRPPDPSAPKAGYMHLQGFAVQLGERVSEGQVVGWSDTHRSQCDRPPSAFLDGQQRERRGRRPDAVLQRGTSAPSRRHSFLISITLLAAISALPPVAVVLLSTAAAPACS